MAGEITTLGVGSGLQLQDILEQLREVDQQVVDQKQDKIADLNIQLNEFTGVNNKLLSLKSIALDLSLSSTYLGRSVTSSDEDVLTATVVDSATVETSTIDVTKTASKSSWLSSVGMTVPDSIVYVPTTQDSTTGVTTPAADAFITEDGTLSITFGGSNTIDVAVTNGMLIGDLVTAINNDAENVGTGDNLRHVTASTFVQDSQTYLRIETDTAGGTGENHRVAVSGLTNTSFAAPDEVLEYQLNGETTSINIAADTTLSGLADLINNDSNNLGVTASAINDGDSTAPYRLVVQADDFGEDSRISFLSQLPDITMEEDVDQAAAGSLNAQFSVDGINYQRQTNSINDVLSGVTFTLQGSGSASLSVGNNNDQITDMIKGLVTAYNDAVQEIQAKSSYDTETEEFGPLAGTTIRDLPFQLQNIMTSSNSADSDGNIRNLFDLGLEFDRTGNITINEEILDAAIAAHPEGVSAFFLGDSDEDIVGFADLVNERLRTITGSSGQVAAEKNAAQTRIDDLELKIEEETDRLDKKYELLTKQFIELDQYMSQMTSMSNFLTSQFDSLSKAWAGSSGSN